MNRVCLIGRLTVKPEIRYGSSNVAVTRFSLAVNRNFTNNQGQREADFITIVAWRKQAELICNYFDKGSMIGIEGRIQTGSYDDKDGKKVYTTEVVVDQIHFIESKGQAQNRAVEEQGPTPYDFQKAPTNSVNIDEDPFKEFGDNIAIDEDFLD